MKTNFKEDQVYYIKHKTEGWEVISKIDSVSKYDVYFNDILVISGYAHTECWDLSLDDFNEFANFTELEFEFNKENYPEYYL